MYEQNILSGQLTEDMSFSQKVWALTSRVPHGKVTTYRAIAQRLNTKGYRAIGMAMNRNPYAPAVPCHRVVGSDGSLTGFAHGIDRKREMLLAEGISITDDRVDLDDCLHIF